MATILITKKQGDFISKSSQNYKNLKIAKYYLKEEFKYAIKLDYNPKWDIKDKKFFYFKNNGQIKTTIEIL